MEAQQEHTAELYYIRTTWLGRQTDELRGPYQNIPALAFALFSRLGSECADSQAIVIERLEESKILDMAPIVSPIIGFPNGQKACYVYSGVNPAVKAFLPCEVWVVILEVKPSFAVARGRRGEEGIQLPMVKPLIGTFLSPDAAMAEARRVAEDVCAVLGVPEVVDLGGRPGVLGAFRAGDENGQRVFITVRRVGSLLRSADGGSSSVWWEGVGCNHTALEGWYW